MPKSTVGVAHGGKSRLKQVVIAGNAEALSHLITQRIGATNRTELSQSQQRSLAPRCADLALQ
ncbi:MAG: hypothetical protein WBQ20_04460 [Methyloceanibacter sp.]